MELHVGNWLVAEVRATNNGYLHPYLNKDDPKHF
jgi:hypothetical protein